MESNHTPLYHDSRRISLVEAIARQEGFGRPGVRATMNHNPGNINYGHHAVSYGSVGEDDKGYAIFTSNMDGFAALKALLLSKAYKGMTFRQALLKYCPPKGDPRGDNNTATYIANVCAWCKVTADDVIDAYVDPNTIAA